MNKIKFILKYISYYLKAKTKHGVHPPFLYHLVTEVINDKKNYASYKNAEAYRASLLKNKQEIYCEDFGTGTSENRKIAKIAKHSAKSPKYAQLLYRLVKELKPANILELGTSLGVSTTYMALANPEANIRTIEGSEDIAYIANQGFVKNNITNIAVINNNIDMVLKNTLAEMSSVDLVFFDGNHQREATRNYFEKCLQYHHNNTVFIFDDIHWSNEMEGAWNYITAKPEVTLSLDLFFMGIVFFRKELSKENFSIRF